ncbi:MAG: hypothetical protein KAS76_00365, partial [Thermoplasmatales archaeon]|nr:hypothetical protein [Thermoplasmatales archaeon]
MKFDLKATFTFSNDISQIKKEIESYVSNYSKVIIEKDKSVKIENIKIQKNHLSLNMVSAGVFRPHNALLQMKNSMSKEFGKKHKLGVREINIENYEIEFDLEKKPLKKVAIPFADVKSKDKLATVSLKNVDEEFLQRNYIDRMISLVKEKVENQYYEGKGEFWKLIWESGDKKPLWTKDPTEEMAKLGWLKQGPTKGKWFYRPQIAAIMKTMEKIAVEEVLKPLGFQEIIESNIVPFDVWLKTGHLEGMPGEFYYIAEPATRDVGKWERFVDLTKIT